MTPELEFELVARQVRIDKERFIQRLQRNVEVHPNGDCIVWSSSISNRGYPRMNVRGEGGTHHQLSVHRVFAILMTAEPIPYGHEVDHTCCRRNCVRHLQVITAKRNKQLVHERKRKNGLA